MSFYAIAATPREDTTTALGFRVWALCHAVRARGEGGGEDDGGESGAAVADEGDDACYFVTRR